MIPLRPAGLFQSRWAALLWAASILWFASDIAGRKPQADDQGNGAAAAAAADNGADLKALENQVHALERLN